ncbi:MAG: hypothetical protein R3321_11595 [Nitrososphaeraceae archaeon]|nr:hypothetical protein [Nitrososphaeraceae archaeon]
MNKDKAEEPLQYSNNYIQFLAFLKIGFKISYRTVNRIVCALSEYTIIEEMYFTHTSCLIIKIKPSKENLDLRKYSYITYVDASDLTVKKND